MSFLDKLKKMFIEEKEEEKKKEKEIVFTRKKETPWVDVDVLRERLKKEKEEEEKQKPVTIPVQLNGYYQYSIDEYSFGNFFYIYINVHGTLNCEVDGFKISTPIHYKINIASGATKTNAYESLLRNGEDFMDELKDEIISELKEILRDNNVQGIKDKIENGGKIRLDIVFDIDKDRLEK